MAERVKRVAVGMEALPPELLEGIIKRLDVWSISQLCLANTAFCKVILESPSWGPSFRDHVDLQRVLSLVAFSSEIFQCVYDIEFPGPQVRTNRILNKRAFEEIRRLLSLKQSRRGNHPGYRQRRLQPGALASELTSVHCRFLNGLWKSMRREWNYMRWEILDRPNGGYDGEGLGCYVPDGNIAAYFKDYDEISKLRAKMEFIVSVEKRFNAQKAAQVEKIAQLVRKHPTMLKKFKDPGQHPRRNIDHIATSFDRTAEKLRHLRFTVRKPGIHNVFMNPYLPVVPYERTLWLFLASPHRPESPGMSRPDRVWSITPEGHSILASVQDKVDTAVEGLSTLYTKSALASFKEKGIPRLDQRLCEPVLPLPHEKGVSDLDAWSANYVTLPQPFYFTKAEIPTLFDMDPRPSFSGRYNFREDGAKVPPYDERELLWLEAFLDSCKAFQKAFPHIYGAVEKEANARWPEPDWESIEKERRIRRLKASKRRALHQG
jgi:hypothetical protein